VPPEEATTSNPRHANARFKERMTPEVLFGVPNAVSFEVVGLLLPREL
jgi:hypothetical protein